MCLEENPVINALAQRGFECTEICKRCQVSEICQQSELIQEFYLGYSCGHRSIGGLNNNKGSELFEASNMARASVLTLCTVCLLLVGSFSQPTQGPSASAGVQSGAPAPGPASSRVETRPLTAFSRVALCAPFTVLVQPSAQYQLTIDADDAVKQATTTLIDGDTLLVEANSFTTTNPIKVTVGLPSTALSAIIARGTFPAMVAPGFSASKLSVTSSGTSQLNVLGISVGELTFVVSG